MEIGLDRLPLGKQGRVICVDTDIHLKRRLRDFGFIPGTLVSGRYRTPDRSVTALEFRGTVVALRTRDMRNIRVEV